MHNYQRSIAAAVGAFVLVAAWLPTSRASADAPSYYEPPKFKIQIKPNYPESARVAHETGTVFVKVLVGADGKQKQIVIAKSSGHKDLDDEVLRVAKLSTYYPATRDGKATVAFYDFSYSFTLAGLSETAAAQSENSKKLAENPKDVGARLGLIEADITKKDYTHAESLADQGIALMPNDARIWSARGAAYYSDGSDNDNNRLSNEAATAKLKISVDSYEKATQLDPKSVTASITSAAYAEYAFHLWAGQQSTACLPFAQKAVQQSPKNWQYIMLKGDCETGTQDYKAAIADYQTAISLDDKKNAQLSSRLVASLANAQLLSGDEAGGLQSINQAERIDPKAPYAYQYQASYYITKNPPNLNAALNPLLQLAQVQPQNVQAQINIGDIYVRQKNYAAAQGAYNKAIQIDPKSADAQFGLAELSAAQGDIKSINAPLGKAIALSPDSAALYNANISGLLLQSSTAKVDLTPDALTYADAATKADPNYGWGWYYLGVSYGDQQKKDQANSALRKAFDVFKAKNDQAGMDATNSQFISLNGKDNSLITGSGRNERTNQPGTSGP